ncbi:MAG: SDR family oxidoreductase [Desulfobacterales bacterium]|nr:SDR family oxidoreductase [Desulfobacterales bacterium]
MKLDFTGKTALVTGGTTGIGFSTAKMLLEFGAKVVVAGRSEDKGKKALQALNSFEGNIVFVQADVSKVSDCKKIVDETVSRFGRLDSLINSAGVFIPGLIEEVTEEQYDWMMDINTKGTFFSCKYAVPEIRKAGGGAIVNISSDAGVLGNTNSTVYCASKGAITIFTKALAMDVAKDQIRVNCVCPGDVKTPMLEADMAGRPDADQYLKDMISAYPGGKIAEPEEVAAIICFLASETAPFVIGSAWSVDGGLTACSY